MKISILTWILIELFACTNQKIIQENRPPFHLIDFTVDSFKNFQLNTSEHSFIKMIQDEKNILWHFNKHNTLEKVNLLQPDSIINSNLPTELKGVVLSNRQVIIDTFDGNEIYICKRNLIKYNSKLKFFTPTQIKQCGEIHLLEKYILNKLSEHKIVILNKSTLEIDTISEVKGYLYDVRDSKTFGIIINSKQYDPISNTLTPITKIGKVSVPEGFNYLLEQDSFICYSPGRTVNIVHAIINNKHYPEHFLAHQENRIIENGILWGVNTSINKWNLIDQTQKSFEYALPEISSGKILNDSYKYWILSNPLYSFNRKDELFYQYPKIIQQSKILDAFQDQRHLYILYDNLFVIYNKEYLDNHKKMFDALNYLNTRQEYEKAIYSSNLKKAESYKSYMEISKKLENSFHNFLSITEIIEHHKANENIWNSKRFRNDLYQVILNNNVDTSFLRINYMNLIEAICVDGQLAETLKLDSFMQQQHSGLRSKIYLDNRYRSSILSVNHYFKKLDSLQSSIRHRDSLNYLSVLALGDVCKSAWFCHEGCGGCNFKILLNALDKFINSNPSSILISDAHYQRINYKYLYNHESVLEKEKEYLKYIETYPDSPNSLKAFEELMDIYFSDEYSDYYVTNRKAKGIKLLEKIKKAFPGYTNTKEIKEYEKLVR